MRDNSCPHRPGSIAPYFSFAPWYLSISFTSTWLCVCLSTAHPTVWALTHQYVCSAVDLGAHLSVRVWARIYLWIWSCIFHHLLSWDVTPASVCWVFPNHMPI